MMVSCADHTCVMFSGGLVGKLGEEKVNPLSVPAS